MMEDSQDEIRELQERLVQKEKKIHALEKELTAYAAQNDNLQKYLNLFLNHPVYKVYKFLKNLLGFRDNPVAMQDSAYQTYQRIREPGEEELAQQKSISRSWTERPQLAIVTAVFNPPLSIFQETSQSVLHQSYENWIWYVANVSTDSKIARYLEELAGKDQRIHPVRLEKNEGISGNLNRAIREISEEFILLLDHDDTLAPNACYAVAETIQKHPDADFVYSDSDKLDQTGRRCEVWFKPDWSPETMLSANLMSHLGVFRRKWLEMVGGLNPELDGAQDWDFFFRIIERTDRVYHIPKVLYHWRKSRGSTADSTQNKPGIHEAQTRAIESHLKRIGLVNPRVHFDRAHPIHHTHPLCSWNISKPKKISIIIPSRDHSELLDRCLSGIFQQTQYLSFEIILVDTGSVKKETWQLYDHYSQKPNFKVVRLDTPFNFGTACNSGARASDGELLLFLNNDTEILHGDWLQLMAQWFELKDVGIVGAKLLYPGMKIQHAGVIIGLGGLAAHVFSEVRENQVSMFGSDGWYRNYSAVTGACMMISREAFETAGCFDEEFRLNWSDIQLCMQVRGLGYRIVYTPNVRLIHHESVTSGKRIPRADFERASKCWHDFLAQGDPYFNPNLSYGYAMPRILFGEEEGSFQINKALMRRLPEKEMICLPADLEGPSNR